MLGWLLEHSPLSILLYISLLVCAYTRIQTGIQSRRQQASRKGPKQTAVLPYWVPYLGHAFSFATNFPGFLTEASKHMKDGVFHVVLTGIPHNIVKPPSVVRQIFLQRDTITNHDFTFLLLGRFFGDKKGELQAMDPHLVFGKIHAPVARLNRDPFVSEAAMVTQRLTERRIHDLLSFSSSWVDHSLWERVGNATVDPAGKFVEADFFPLVQYFVADIATTALMGHEFMNNNPDFINDLYTLDSKFQNFLIGLPIWWPGMASAYRARARCRTAVEDLQQALYDTWDERDPGTKWGDLSDVSNVIQDRARVFRETGCTSRVGGLGDFTLIWAMNVNANQTIWWLLWRIYSSPSLRAEIMEEIAPYATLTDVKSGLPIKELPRLQLHLDGLLRECPLIKSSFYETMRIAAASPSYKKVVETFNVTESAEDAALDGKSEPQTYQFNKGEYICLPHGAHSADGRYFEDPEVFKPRRFIVKKSSLEKGDENNGTDPMDKKEKKEQPEEVTVDMGTMKVFGGGATMCKGRNFVEREVVIFVAAILTAWDVEPVSGTWTNPGHKSGSGVYQPAKNVRARFRRREVTK